MWISKPPAGTGLNRNHPLAQGLVGCWLLNEGNGLRANDLAQQNHGNLTDFEPFSSASGWTGGNNGTSLSFDGTNDSINCGTLGNNDVGNGSNNFTIEAYINSKDSSSLKAIAGKVRFSVNEWGLHQASGTWRFQIRNSTVGLTVIDTTPYITNTWYQIVGTRDELGINIFVNGVFKASTLGTKSPDTSNSNFFIGRRTPDNNFNFNGIISHVRIWNRSLSPMEIQRLYSQPYEMFWNPSERLRKYHGIIETQI